MKDSICDPWPVALCLSALAFAGCGGSEAATTECQFEYETLGAAASTRLDLLFETEEGVIKRLVRETGEEDTASIFYRFDSPERSAVLHELDSDNDGSIDSVMSRSDVLLDRVDLYQVDALADDNMVDSLQVSVSLPSNDFAGWVPTRMFYTIPCGPSHKLTASEDDGLVTLDVDLNEDGSIDTEMRMFFTDVGIDAWTVDHNKDGTVEFWGKANYTDDGKIESVQWLNWEFAPVAVSTWTYDESGNLASLEEDMNGDGVVDNKLRYSSACWTEASDEE